MPKSSNKDQRLRDALGTLKRHLDSCSQCKSARKTFAPHDMCRDGLMFTLYAASQYGDTVKLRIAALNNPGNYVFACPDLSKHGQGYALTAEPLQVTNIQGTLF